ncbi:hypothetical protein V1504DRAFT_287718 [Lipomyces starkeyi]
MNAYESGKLPQYIYSVPNLLNNAHNITVAYDGNYLKNLWGEYFDDKVPMENTLVIVTFDENEDTEHNHIYGALPGGAVKADSLPDLVHTLFRPLRQLRRTGHGVV